jgi:cyclopropane fatty-acyl-phospholipid synthase-like methyltransferase
MASEKPHAPATDRNRDAILGVLRDELKKAKSVLEIGSGTGQHAVFFARELAWLQWQTSDREQNHDGINAWLSEASLVNVDRPLSLDVEEVGEIPGDYDAVFSANTAHIMSFDAVKCMFAVVANCLTTNGCFCLYGPFKIDGDFTSESNESFNASLKTQDPQMGIRDLESLHELAAKHILVHEKSYAMPANNMLIVWRKGVDQ